ncbi:MAG: hypothetical protein ABS68_10255 [Niastella sp. SCN 39-18]|nr:MAG: hypothetical protein ABS68_10255 [Niastella sp. SCN 39-18]OJW11039.1 MAG: hypothetical protein BGO53_01605 [Sphingobacteriales bacterium 39-19]
MKKNNEISALLRLIDDPDEYVYHTVSEKLVSLGKEIIPSLENLWETISNEETQERIEMLIHRVHFRDLSTEFIHWKNNKGNLMQGALLAARYHYPDLEENIVLQEIEKIRRNTWLELSSYLTPMEQVNVVNSIFFNYYKQKGVEMSYDNPDHFLINKTLETHKGNAIGNGIIYLILCELLDLPVKAIHIPRQFILAYMDNEYEAFNQKGHSSEQIKFYIDALSGQMYAHKDIEAYFKKMSVHPASSYFRPQKNEKVIQFLLEELSKCFDNDRNNYKMDELLSLSAMLDD